MADLLSRTAVSAHGAEVSGGFAIVLYDDSVRRANWRHVPEGDWCVLGHHTTAQPLRLEWLHSTKNRASINVQVCAILSAS